MLLRKADEKLLLLSDGTLALSSQYCGPDIWCWSPTHGGTIGNASVYLDPFRPIEQAWYARNGTKAWNVGNGAVSRATLYGRWDFGMYPTDLEPKDLAFCVFGVEFPPQPFPVMPNHYYSWGKEVCTIEIKEDGHVFVNGQFCGIWEKFKTGSE